MQSGLLLLVDADRRAQRGVTRVASESGIEVVACDSARAGLNAACALEPAAIVTELELPDFDGYWFVAQIRQQPTDVASSPIVVVTHEIDTSSRAGTLKAGADVFLQKPIAPGDLLAQTRALIDMVHRVRERRPATASAPGPMGPGMLPAPIAPSAVAAPYMLPPSGGLDRFPAATVLVALELERRSGKVTLRPPGAVGPPIEIDLASGLILEGRIQGRTLDPLAVVRAALTLHEGYFEFVPGPDRPAPPAAEFTGKLFGLAAESAASPRSRRGGPVSVRPPRGEPASSPSTVPPSDDAGLEKAFAKVVKAPTKPPPKAPTARPPKPPVQETAAAGPPSKPPKSPTAKPPPVKVPPPRVPAFGPTPKPPLAKPGVPQVPAAPGAAAQRPAALAHTSAAKPGVPQAPPARVPPATPAAPNPAAPRAAASTGPDSRKRGAGRRSMPPSMRPDADEDDVIEAENDG